MKLLSLLIALILYTDITALDPHILSVIRSWTFNREVCEKSSNQPHYTLRHELLCDYDVKTRPKLEHTNATKVFVKLRLKSFIYDTLSHKFSVNAWLTIYWQDDHLKWNPTDYHGIKMITMSSLSIWTPDLSFYNRYHQNEDGSVISAVDCFVNNTGMISCVPPIKFETLCSADLANFPFDAQICKLYFGSWAYPGEVLDFQLNKKPIDLSELTANPEWKLLYASAFRHKGEYAENAVTFPMIIYTFSIQRRSSFYQATLVTPLLGLLVVCLVAQFMDVTTRERFTLIIFNIISHVMFMQYVSWQVPNVGDSVPKIILFCKDSIIVTFVQLIITTILKNVTKSQDDMPTWVSGIVGKTLDSRNLYKIIISFIFLT